MEFIHNQEFLNNSEVCSAEIFNLIRRLLNAILQRSENQVNQSISHNHTISEIELKEILLNIIRRDNSTLEQERVILNLQKKNLNYIFEHIKRLIDSNVFIEVR